MHWADAYDYIHHVPLTVSLVSKVAKGDPDFDGNLKTAFRLNFGLLIQRYVRGFCKTDPNVALRYYYMLRYNFVCHVGLIVLQGLAGYV